jgi:hypothetical protein
MSRYKLPQPCPTLSSSSYGLFGSCAMSAKLHGITLKTVISVLITTSSFTHTSFTNTCIDKVTLFRQNCQRHWSIQINNLVL